MRNAKCGPRRHGVLEHAAEHLDSSLSAAVVMLPSARQSLTYRANKLMLVLTLLPQLPVLPPARKCEAGKVENRDRRVRSPSSSAELFGLIIRCCLATSQASCGRVTDSAGQAYGDKFLCNCSYLAAGTTLVT